MLILQLLKFDSFLLWHQGRFEIISLTGSYVRNELGTRTGGLSVCLSNTDGQIIGGGVGGPLKAAGPVQVISERTMKELFGWKYKLALFLFFLVLINMQFVPWKIVALTINEDLDLNYMFSNMVYDWDIMYH